MINSIKPIEANKKTETTSVKFRPIRETTRINREYNPAEIFILKAGQKINLYDFVQESAQDLEIYEVIEKYGQKTAIEMLNTNRSQITGDLTGAPKDLREAIHMKKEAEEAEQKIQTIIKKHKEQKNKEQEQTQNTVKETETKIDEKGAKE